MAKLPNSVIRTTCPLKLPQSWSPPLGPPRLAYSISNQLSSHVKVSAKPPQFGRSSDNRRFCSPNYSAWRRSRTESLLSNARYSINPPPCARSARALGAPRTAHSATPPLGAGAAWLLLSLADLRSRHCFVARFVRPRRRGFLLVCNENRSR